MLLMQSHTKNKSLRRASQNCMNLPLFFLMGLKGMQDIKMLRKDDLTWALLFILGKKIYEDSP